MSVKSASARPQPRLRTSTASADAPAFSQAFNGPAGEGLVAIAGADRSFDPDGFAEGAKQAYTMIVEAYAKGDRDTLEPLLSERVYKAYDASIADREAKNQTLITEIERIKRNEIVEASLNDNRAKVKVAFSVELARELRDSDGKAVDGDLTVLQTVEEIWSFERDVTSTIPTGACPRSRLPKAFLFSLALLGLAACGSTPPPRAVRSALCRAGRLRLRHQPMPGLSALRAA
jgi:predicted lipid-binding transport protein (Tim44 family)